MYGSPASTYDSTYIIRFVLSNLSDADLQAVATALQNAVTQNGLDLALWDAEMAVEQEILRRAKASGSENSPEDDQTGKQDRRH
jgi:hypothetical protein